MFSKTKEFIEVDDPSVYRPVLEREHFRHCSMINHLYFEGRDKFRLLVDDLDNPRMFILEERGGKHIELRGPVELATAYLDSLEPGPYDLHNAEREVYDLFKERFDVTHDEPSLVFRLDPGDFKPEIKEAIVHVHEDEAGIIDRNWGLAPDHAWFFRERIKGGHVLGVRRGGELIGWAGSYFETDRYCLLGYLHVLKPYRGKGIAYSLASAKIRDVLSRGKVPYAHIWPHNTASLDLNKRLGLKEAGWTAWIFR